MSSLIECLVDPNCHGMHDDNYHFQWEKDAMTEPTPVYDSWTVHASSGDHVVENAADVADAFYQFQLTHPDDFVHGVSVVTDDEKHSALCRSRISGETEDRCNCKED